MSERKITMEIDGTEVVFTNHSIERFQVRHQKMSGQTLKNPEKTAKKILAKASKDENMDPIKRVNRIINNNFTEAHYFINSGWRFVIIEKDNKFVVVTIERVS